MRSELKSGVWRCWLAEANGKLIGHVWVAVVEKIPNPVGEPRFHVYVSNCYVVPERRSQRVGERLLKTALAWCQAKGADAVFLWPTARSRSFYSKCGFKDSANILVRQRKGRATHHRQIAN
jgi:GNAT superfamily N-acetyltransferase